MRRLIWPVLFLFLLVIQGASSVFYSRWLSFDLPLIAVYCYALLNGSSLGGLAGFGVGFLQDAMTVGVFGFHMLTRTFTGYIVGDSKEKIFKEKYKLHLIAVGSISAIIRFIYWWIEVIRSGGRWGLFMDFIWASVGYCLGNMLLVIPMFFALKIIDKWTKKNDINY